jgi:ribosomal protein S18 acetylase RimI-like enzyme
MADLPASLFLNPVWSSLETRHRHFAIERGAARRYPAAVAPFVAVAEPSASALRDLRELMVPSESVWIIGAGYPFGDGFVVEQVIECPQMILPENVHPASPADDVLKMTEGDAGAMVGLTDIAFPGFFRVRTCQMGTYYGVREGGELIAMGGERMMPGAYTELSGVCTHPAYRGKGLASRLIWQLVRDHRRDGVVSWLHVTSTNTKAIDLYKSMGFETVRQVTVSRICVR